YALTRFLIVICFAAFRSQWNPIARSKQQNICSINKGDYHHNANDRFGLKEILFDNATTVPALC
ncbi:MAG: hypothetical protein IKI05_00990, partial [Bacteroidaceae bacterium]|nr:hypothetical protein [Bacteroidaceae bacterium]